MSREKHASGPWFAAENEASMTPDTSAMDEKELEAAAKAIAGDDWNWLEPDGREEMRQAYIADAKTVIAAYLAATAREDAPVGEAGTMPGTDGFTMACFKAVDVPVGSKLYRRSSLKAEVVKLEWEETDERWWGAQPFHGFCYEIRVTDRGGTRVRWPENGGWTSFDGDLGAAKAAAQSDFESRIRSCLAIPQPAPDTEGDKP